ncbi:MAG: TetR/AcrR family transcriptional regulator [Rickettsiales bacterium]|jgi:AcrR family transcriptional regulator|nr:TetR/AcrR family transcriptional regulator [Rickettsiales bacterium]
MAKPRKTNREHIIKITAELINEQGKDNIGTRDIADKCNIGTATLYDYFESLDALHISVIQYVAKDLLSVVKEDLLASSLIKTLVQYSQKNKNLWKLLFEFYPKKEDVNITNPEKKELLEFVISRFIDYYKLKNTEENSVLISSLIIGVISLDLNNNLSLIAKKKPEELLLDVINKYLK